jgi:uncharacterized protein with PIN domain
LVTSAASANGMPPQSIRTAIATTGCNAFIGRTPETEQSRSFATIYSGSCRRCYWIGAHRNMK